MLKIAATGSRGLVGSRIVELLGKDFHFIHLSQEDLDITDKVAVQNALKDLDYDIFLHLAAYTNVDGAETERELAYKINVEGTRNVLEMTQEKNKKFIYISTGFVFDGTQPPYVESSQPNPIGYYGQTKYEGEKIVGADGMIIRLEYPYRAHFVEKKDFVRSIRARLQQHQLIQGITDSIITPTFIYDFSFALKYLINNFSPETFHLVGGDSLSPYDAARLIAKVFQLDSFLVHKTTYETYFRGKAKRPQFAEVKSTKNTFYKMKTFEEGLHAIKKILSAA